MILVEVLSKSMLRYLNIPSLKEYVLIEQDVASIKVLRSSHEWRTEYYTLGDTMLFVSIGLSLTVEEIYDRVDIGEMNEYRQMQVQLAADIA